MVLVAARVRTGVRIESMKKKTSLPSLGAVPAGTFRARNFAGRAVQLRSYSVRPPAEQWCVVVDQIEASFSSLHGNQRLGRTII